MMPDWMISIILKTLVCVSAVLVIREYMGLRKVIKESPSERAHEILFEDSHLSRRLVTACTAAALHGHLYLDELHKYYDPITD